jgi:hypothetical protein
MCNDIGEASYIDSLVAAALLQTINSLPGRKQYVRKINERYKLKMEGGLCAQRRGSLAGQQGVVLLTQPVDAHCWAASCCGSHVGSLQAASPSPTQHPACLPACLPPSADYQEEEYVHALGDRLFNCEPERAGQRILKDFRNLALGNICLEVPQQYEHYTTV